MSEKLVLTVEEAGEMLGVSRPIAYKLIKVEGFPVIRIGRRVLIPKQGLEEWLKNCEGKQVLPNGMD